MRTVELKDITHNLDSRRIPLNSKQRSEKEANPLYPYIGANNIMGYIDEFIFDEKILCIAEDGGSWGYQETCARIYKEKVWVNNHAHVLTAKEDVILEYLMYFLNYTDLSLYINGATRGKLTKTSLNSIKVPVPPLSQQKKIAAILDAADDYRQKTKALIAKYDEFLRSTIYECLGDAINKDLKALKSGDKDFLPEVYTWFELRDITEAIADIDHKMPKSVDKGKIFLSAKDLSDNGELDFTAPKYISEEDFKHLSRKIKPEKGDIIYSRIGAKLGKARLVKTDHDFIVSYSCCTIRPLKEKVSALYLRYVLDSKVTLRQANHGTKSIGVPDLGMNEIRSFKIPVPDAQEMKKIEERLSLAETQKAKAEESLTKAEDLFNSLLQKAFKGDLT